MEESSGLHLAICIPFCVYISSFVSDTENFIIILGEMLAYIDIYEFYLSRLIKSD